MKQPEREDACRGCGRRGNCPTRKQFNSLRARSGVIARITWCPQRREDPLDDDRIPTY